MRPTPPTKTRPLLANARCSSCRYFNLVGGEVPTIWVAMERVDAENGCLRYVPGTHTQPLRTHVLSELRGFSQMVQSWTEEDEAAAIPVVSRPPPPACPLAPRRG